jgi:GNAT superfamily N-acetyltransferase
MTDLESLAFVDIVDCYDAYLLPWLDLYETAFPAPERMLISQILALVVARHRGEETGVRLLAALEAGGELVGMAMYSIAVGKALAWLWYIAVVPQARGKGIGSRIYREVWQRVERLGVKALILEVEIPEEDNEREAVRRIQFYRWHGAGLLAGIHYMQRVGWHQAPIPMHVMVHARYPISPEEAFELAQSLFGDAIQRTGTLAFA